MADDQTEDISTGLENFTDPLPGGLPSGVQMPSGGLLDPSGQDPAWSLQAFSQSSPGVVNEVGNTYGAPGAVSAAGVGLAGDARDHDINWGAQSPSWDPFKPTQGSSPYAVGFGPPELHFKSLQGRLADPNVDKLKDEYGNPRGTQYLAPAPPRDYNWEILGDYLNVGLSLLAAKADPELSIEAREKLAEDEFANRPKVPYDRIPQFGRTPTPADRAAIGAGVGQVGDHQPTLVERWYFGDWARGEIPGYMMTPSQRAASAADRTRMKVQSQTDSNIQGGHMAAFSRRMKRQFRIDLENDD
jgi:hypothetical protein